MANYVVNDYDHVRIPIAHVSVLAKYARNLFMNNCDRKYTRPELGLFTSILNLYVKNTVADVFFRLRIAPSSSTIANLYMWNTQFKTFSGLTILIGSLPALKTLALINCPWSSEQMPTLPTTVPQYWRVLNLKTSQSSESTFFKWFTSINPLPLLDTLRVNSGCNSEKSIIGTVTQALGVSLRHFTLALRDSALIQSYQIDLGHNPNLCSLSLIGLNSTLLLEGLIRTQTSHTQLKMVSVVVNNDFLGPELSKTLSAIDRLVFDASTRFNLSLFAIRLLFFKVPMKIMIDILMSNCLTSDILRVLPEQQVRQSWQDSLVGLERLSRSDIFIADTYQCLSGYTAKVLRLLTSIIKVLIKF
ncbi:hypothetical protein H0H87_012359 [Tephrocybe sp. NHM501043]|nr:hypothetical protein H0H87_012359 [Tephrocybe sp. NHM501043]